MWFRLKICVCSVFIKTICSHTKALRLHHTSTFYVKISQYSSVSVCSKCTFKLTVSFLFLCGWTIKQTEATHISQVWCHTIWHFCCQLVVCKVYMHNTSILCPLKSFFWSYNLKCILNSTLIIMSICRDQFSVRSFCCLASGITSMTKTMIL